MKLRLCMLLTALCLSLGLLTACGDNDKDTASQVTSNPASTVSDSTIMDDIVSESDKIEDKVESTVDKVLPGDGSGTESKMASEPVSDASSNDASLAVSTLPTVDLGPISKLNNEFHGWGQGTIVDDQNVPVGCTDFQNLYGKYSADFVKDTDKTVTLTFDEGYENGYTGEILDVLKEKQCPAVFFVTLPYAKAEPELIQRMVEEGHIVGNHTANHPSMPKTELTQQVNEIAELHDYIQSNFGVEMSLFRPPMGEFSEQSLAVTQALGYRSVFWSFAYKDWDPDSQPEQTAALKRTTEAAHNGAIYLLHAVSKTNTEILGSFIDTLRSQGYTFGTIS